MKNKTITIILSCTLMCSIALNIYLFYSLSATRGQVAVISDQVVIADDQINDLHDQLADFEGLQNQVSQLEKKLADSEEQIGALENSLAESTEQIKSLEAVLTESQATIAELEKQQQQNEKPVETPAPEVQTPASQPASNTMPTGPDIDWHDSSGIGDGSGAIGMFGTYE